MQTNFKELKYRCMFPDKPLAICCFHGCCEKHQTTFIYENDLDLTVMPQYTLCELKLNKWDLNEWHIPTRRNIPPFMFTFQHGILEGRVCKTSPRFFLNFKWCRTLEIVLTDYILERIVKYFKFSSYDWWYSVSI